MDIGTGQHHAVAVKRDGTLWSWDEPLVANYRYPTLRAVEPESAWVSVYCGNETTFALRNDGTLWAGGNMSGFQEMTWIGRALSFPTLVCAETNWIALDANGLARNSLGELWDVRMTIPNPQARASAVCYLINANGNMDRVHSVSPWARTVIHKDGTLWMAQVRPGPPAEAPPEDWRQLGSRSDWVAAWGHAGTEFGLTTDGTVWTWGKELSIEPVKNYESRLDILRDRLTGRRPTVRETTVPASVQPRPLLKLVGGKSNQKGN